MKFLKRVHRLDHQPLQINHQRVVFQWTRSRFLIKLRYNLVFHFVCCEFVLSFLLFQAAINESGLGLLSWWDSQNAQPDEEENEEEGEGAYDEE